VTEQCYVKILKSIAPKKKNSKFENDENGAIIGNIF
jgi:hypothetical protein